MTDTTINRHAPAMRFLILAAVLLVAGPASAQRDGFVLPDLPSNLERWVLVLEGDFSVTYVDRNTITREGPFVTIWEWSALYTPMVQVGGRPEMDRSISRTRYDCERRTVQGLFVTDYRRGVSVRTADMAERGIVYMLQPDSYGEAVLDAVCS